MKAKDLEYETKAENTSNDEAPTGENVDTSEEESKADVNQKPSEDSERSDETSEEPSEEPKKKGVFKGKEKKDKKDELIQELNDKVIRQMAEFDNYRKRTDKEKSQMFDIGAKSIIEKILPVIDNFERGLAVLSEEERSQPFAQGIEKVYKQMMTSLTDAGLKEIEAEGKEFNSDIHNAVMHVDDENVGENIVVEVFQKGYYYKDSVVRHSMVKVAN